MGHADAAFSVTAGTCVYIPTGGVLPAGANAVVMMEYTDETGDTVLVKRPVSFGENILLHDDDYRRGAVVLPSGRRLSPRDAGVLAACGRTSVTVSKKPVVGIISTGNELVPAAALPGRGRSGMPMLPCLPHTSAGTGAPPGTTGLCPMNTGLSKMPFPGPFWSATWFSCRGEVPRMTGI